MKKYCHFQKATEEEIKMIPAIIKCDNCGATTEVSTYRKFVVCPFCDSRFPFDGFEYNTIDWSESKYSQVEKWMDCPACRSKNMYLGSSARTWKCPDCGYLISRFRKLTGAFWFCNECDAFLNVQDGFSSSRKRSWKCSVCGHENGLTLKDIL